MRINFIAASSAALCLTGGLPALALEYGNLDVIQLNNSNRGLTEIDPAVSVTVAPGSTPIFTFTGANRGDIDMNFGTPDDVTGGVMITSVRENGRDNTAGGDTGSQAGIKYVTPLSESGSGINTGRFFIPLESSPDSFEFNINTAAVYFPFNEDWLGGHTRNSNAANGGVQDLLTASSGISIGTHFVDNGSGNFTINLSSLTSHGVTATSQNGVLLVTGHKNEDNYAMSSDNANGSFAVALKHNGADGAGTERDPIAFAYVPVAAAGNDLVTAVGRIQNDGSAEISGGNFTVTHLVDTFEPVNATGDIIELAFDVVVTDATGIAVGQSVTGNGIPDATKVAAVNGTTITLSQAATATATAVALTFQTPPTQGRWLLQIPNHSATTGTLIVTPCTGGTNNRDNIISYQWDATLGGWVIESRDIVPALGVPVLEDGATPDEDMFNFVFFTTQPANIQPTVSITSPADGAEIETGNSVTITAEAADTAPGTVVAVEFHLNGQLVSTSTTAPHSYTTPVYNVPAGAQVDVVAVDNDGARTYARKVVYTVTPPGGSGGLYFNGVNEYVALGDPASLKLSTFTLETWFRRVGTGTTATTGSGGVIAAPLITKGRDQADQSNLDTNYFLGIRPDGVLVADFEDSNLGINVPVTGKTSVPLDEWHHVAATFDGTKWMLYLDGNLEASRDAGGLVPRADSIQQAALASALNSTGLPVGYFNGYLDEVRIWNTARTQTQIRSSVNFETTSETGLVARWNMVEGTGAIITSTATGSLAGNLINAPFWTPGQTFTNNVLPGLGITAPVNGSRFLFGQPIPITVTAADPDGAVQEVRFYDNGNLISTDSSGPFEFSYTNAPLGGSHVLTAVAVDSGGAMSLSEEIGVEVTVPGSELPGYSAGIINGGDTDIDDLPPTPPADPANWQIEATTLAPRAFELPGPDLGDFAVNIAATPVAFNSGILLASNHSIVGNLAATDNSLAPYQGPGGEYILSTIDNEDPGATDPIASEESSRFSLGYFPFADGWIGANVDETGAVISGSQNLPAGVTITHTGPGAYQISGLPTIGNLLVVPLGDTSDNVVAVSISGQSWIVNQRDNNQEFEDGPFGFVFVPTTATQVFSGQIAENGSLKVLNDELAFVGATTNRGTQGYEITIGDGNIINPSNASLFIVADSNVGPAGDNVMSYAAVGNAFVVFSQDLPGLNGQFQAGGFRFLVVPHDPVAINGDEVVVVASDNQATENSLDDIEFTFTRSGNTGNPLTVSYTAGGSATAGSDYASLPGTVTFPAGVASVVVPVSASGDISLETAETLSVAITAGTGYSVGIYDTAIGTIINGGVLIPKTTVSFQEGVDGYTGQWDRRVGENGTAQNGSAVQQYAVDGNPGADDSEDVNGLIRFSNIFGTGPGQIPPGAEVIDARLTITTADVTNAQSGGPWAIDRLILEVNDTTTYASLGGDADPSTFDGLEGARGASTGLPLAGFTGMDRGEVNTADVTQIVKAWAEGEPNYGFSIFSSPTTDGWNFDTVGNTNPLLRPKLEVTYTTLPVKDYYFLADRSAIVNSQSATQDASTIDTLFLDLNDGTTGTTEMLLKFPVQFGAEGENTIPIGEEIVKAELVLSTHAPFYGGSSNAQSAGPYAVHQMIADWQVELPATNYGNLGPVVGTHIEPAAVRFGSMGQNTSNYVDVTSIVANWRTGANNYGFNVKPETTDGWQPFLPGVLDHPLLSSGAPLLRIQTAIYSPGSFDNWASANGIPGSNLEEDHDRDGIPAVVEYGLGLNPRAFNLLPPLGANRTLSFQKGAEAAADAGVTYKLQVSENLVNWITLTPTVNDATQITGQLPGSSSTGKIFGRLAVDYTR